MVTSCMRVPFEMTILRCGMREQGYLLRWPSNLLLRGVINANDRHACSTCASIRCAEIDKDTVAGVCSCRQRGLAMVSGDRQGVDDVGGEAARDTADSICQGLQLLHDMHAVAQHICWPSLQCVTWQRMVKAGT